MDSPALTSLRKEGNKPGTGAPAPAFGPWKEGVAASSSFGHQVLADTQRSAENWRNGRANDEENDIKFSTFKEWRAGVAATAFTLTLRLWLSYICFSSLVPSLFGRNFILAHVFK